MKERWKDIKGYKGMYQVSNHGFVRSWKNGGHGKRDKPKEIGRLGNGEYNMVALCNEGDSRSETVHRIVAEAFIPNPENKPCVNHIDGNKKNNHVSNLEWCTYSENINHAVETGLIPPGMKKDNIRIRIDDELKEKFKRHAQTEDKTMSEIVVNYIQWRVQKPKS